MPCYHPVRAFRIGDSLGRPTGKIIFNEKGHDVIQELTIPCGKCIGCNLEKARQWAIRCTHEAQLHPVNCFVTLTYDDDHLPDLHSLDYRHVQLFLKKLRLWRSVYDWRRTYLGKGKGWKAHQLEWSKIRFFMCGEYGEAGSRRPHYHLILFNYDFIDKVEWKKSKSGNTQYTSETLTKLWGNGLATISDVNFEAAQYVAQYCTKKLGGDKSIWDYQVVDPETGEIHTREQEFIRMSLKPGIGNTWYKKFKDEVFHYDRVIIQGKEMKPPKYYKKILEKEDPDLYENVLDRRMSKALKYKRECTEERLAVKEQVTQARIEFYQGKRQI